MDVTVGIVLAVSGALTWGAWWKLLSLVRGLSAKIAEIELRSQGVYRIPLDSPSQQLTYIPDVEVPAEYDLAAAWAAEQAAAGFAVSPEEVRRQRMLREEAGL